MAFGTYGSGFGTPPLGTTPAPFGQANAGQVGTVGAAPAFGAVSTPAFGASAGGAFGGSSAFGAPKPAPGFGASFGSQSAGGLFGGSTPQAGFGATSTFGTPAAPSIAAPAFGGGSVFGSNPFSGGATTTPFGTPIQPASTPGFGPPASTPAFGASPASGGFGSTGFGSSAGAFGSVGFGSSATSGTRQVVYTKTADTDSSGAAGTKNGNLNSISAMQQYQNKQHEELRWEDYQAGVKGGTGAQPQQQVATPAFGAPAGGFGSSPTSPFGGVPSSTTGFGTGGAFGATAAFGTSSSPAFGSGFAAPPPVFAPTASTGFNPPASGGLFGGGNAASSPFGGSSTPAFGGGGGFGAAMPSFGAPSASTPAFGSVASSPAFSGGAFGATPSTGTGFGGLSTTAAFSSAAVSNPTFGTTQQAPSLFGSAATPGTFGGSTPVFSFAPTTPAATFGSTAFGSTPPSSHPVSGSGLFGQPASGNMFGTTAFSTPGGFGAGTATFPASAPGVTASSLFGGVSAPSLSLAPGQQPGTTAAVQLPGVNSSPYGTLPAAPMVASAVTPDYKVGISQRPLGPLVGRGVARPTTVLTPRTITPRSGIKLRAPRPRSLRPSDNGGNGRDGSSSVGATPVVSAMADPRHLVVRDALPTTEAAASVSVAPSRGATPPSLHNGICTAPSADRGSSDGTAAPGSDVDGRDAEEGGSRSPDGSPSPRYEQTPPQRMRFSSSRRPSSAAPLSPAPSSARLRSRRLADDEVADLLPQLDPRSDLVLSPSLLQLAVMAGDDPASLTNVANFTITRPNIGSVQWLEEVDVTGVDVEGLVKLTKGGVEVYLDDATKPPVGEGFNRPARITLCKVYKMDSANNRPSRDLDAIARFTSKLKKISAQQGAKFVSYQPDTGNWKFEVEHFSRYGLVDDDDEEAEGESGGKRGSGASGAAVTLPHAAQVGSSQNMLQGDDDKNDDNDVGAVPSGSPSQDQGTHAGRRQGGGRKGGGPPPSHPSWAGSGRALPVALPAALSLDPGRLASMRDCFQDDHSEGAEAAEHTAALAHLPAAAPSSWLPQKSAISAPSSAATRAGRPPCRSLTPLPPAPSSHHAAPQAAGSASAATSPHVVDAGQALGSVTRASWAPSSMVAHISGVGNHQRVVVRRVAEAYSDTAAIAAASSAAERQRKRTLLLKALEIHAAHSVVIDPAALGGGSATDEDGDREEESLTEMPMWRLKCRREEELRELCLSYTALCTSFITKHGLQDGSERSCLQQEGWTWDLVRLLFEAIPGEAHAAGGPLGGDPSDATGAARIAAFQRRAALSHWLQDGVRSHVVARLRAGASGSEAVSACLTGHQLSAAAAISAACGDTRLATLLTQAGNCGTATADVAAQLTVWADCNITSHIDSQRLQVYEVLAGQVDHVLDAQPDVPWRAALGMHLWYSPGGTVTIARAVEGYDACVGGGHAAPPLTPHRQRRRSPSSGTKINPDQAPPEDVDLQLMRLYVRETSGGPRRPQPLAAAGASPDSLDTRLSWLLTSVLAAVGALPPAATQSLQATAVSLTLVEQLEAAEGLEEWAVYVALHLQDVKQRWKVATEVLCRNAPVFAADPSKRAFLLQRLQVPREALAASLAMYAAYCGQVHCQVGHLLQGGAAALATARQLAAQLIAPQLVVAHRMNDLEALLQRLQGVGEEGGALTPYAHLLSLQAADRKADEASAQYHATSLMQYLASSVPESAIGGGDRICRAATAAAGLSKVAEALSQWSLRLRGDCNQVARLQQSAVANDLQIMASSMAAVPAA